MIIFEKWNGLGNDFVIIKKSLPNLKKLAIKLCNRHFGIGADGLVLILPSKISDAKMRIFNPDGSEAEMCGNAIRCVAKFLNKQSLKIETLAGIIKPEIIKNKIRVNMGKAKFLNNFGKITSISIGNPHAVLFVKNFDFNWQAQGKKIENNLKLFPKKTNVEFVKIINKNNIEIKIWERGAGATLACGTGACASAYASFIKNKTSQNIKVHLPGGKLLINLKKDNTVFMTGDARKVFKGQYDI